MDLHTALMTILVVCAVLTVLSVIFNWLLIPVKENQERIAKDLNQFKTEVNGELKGLNNKLDKLLNK